MISNKILFKVEMMDSAGLPIPVDYQLRWLFNWCEVNGYNTKKTFDAVIEMARVSEEAAEAIDVELDKILHIINLVGLDLYLATVLEHKGIYQRR